MTTVIKQQDFIDSVYEGLQYISYYHPMDFLEALKKAYEREQNQPARMPLPRSWSIPRCAPWATGLCVRTPAL